jgi:transposase-like protein
MRTKSPEIRPGPGPQCRRHPRSQQPPGSPRATCSPQAPRSPQPACASQPARPPCPRCGSGRVGGWGRYRGGHRHRCLDCGRTFTATTATPAAYLKKPALWNLFCDFMRISLPVRSTAAVLGVHKDTAFRWRHRFLHAVRAGETSLEGAPRSVVEPLDGRIFVAETWFMFSEKGKRNLGRPARRHSWVTDWLSAPRAWVVLLGDDSGRHVGRVTGLRRPMVDELEPVLAEVVSRRNVVLTSPDGPYAQLPRTARRLGLRHERVGLHEGARVGAYRRRLKRWLRPFHGVATRYLPNYLAWHRLVDRDDGRSRVPGAPSLAAV